MLTSPFVPIINSYLGSAMRYSKRSKLNKVKIKHYSVDGEYKTEILHAEDLVDIFGTEIIQGINAERRIQ